MTTSAIQIDHRMAKIPAPTKEMLEACALVAFKAMKERVEIHTNTDSADWDDLHEWLRESWLESMKNVYGVIAMHGGAEIKKLDEENMKRKLDENES
jgi:hypothetical protein